MNQLESIHPSNIFHIYCLSIIVWLRTNGCRENGFDGLGATFTALVPIGGTVITVQRPSN
jgi:hypothetical protein